MIADIVYRNATVELALDMGTLERLARGISGPVQGPLYAEKKN